MDVSTPPSLDLASPQAKTEIEKLVHMLREREREVLIKQNMDIEASCELL